jgi:hypothetical protein
MLLLITFLAAVATRQPSPTLEPAPAACSRTFDGSSQPCLDVEEASRQADEQIRGWVLRLAATHLGPAVSETTIGRALPQLLNDRSVRRKDSIETIEKPYGVMYRRHVRIEIPEPALADWLADVQAMGRAERWRTTTIAAVLALCWASGPVLLVGLDRVTRGYCRPLIVSAVGLLLAAATFAVLAWRN